MYRTIALGLAAAILSSQACEAVVLNSDFIRYEIRGVSDIALEDNFFDDRNYTVSAFARRDDVTEKLGGAIFENLALLETRIAIDREGVFQISEASKIDVRFGAQVVWQFGDEAIIFEDIDQGPNQFEGFDLTNNFVAFDPLLISDNFSGILPDGGPVLPIAISTDRGLVELSLSNIGSESSDVLPGRGAMRSPGTFKATVVPLPPAFSSFAAAIGALVVVRLRKKWSWPITFCGSTVSQ